MRYKTEMQRFCDAMVRRLTVRWIILLAVTFTTLFVALHIWPWHS